MSYYGGYNRGLNRDLARAYNRGGYLGYDGQLGYNGYGGYCGNIDQLSCGGYQPYTGFGSYGYNGTCIRGRYVPDYALNAYGLTYGRLF